MRLFIGIPLPSSLSKDLEEKAEEVFKGCPAKIVPKENIHITLRFLGEVPEEKVEEFVERLKRIKFEPFTLSLSNPGAFPSLNFVRVFWLGLEPEEKILNLAEKVWALFGKEERFHPHITLARLKGPCEGIQKAFRAEWPRTQFKVEKIVLYKSILKKPNPEYVAIASAP